MESMDVTIPNWAIMAMVVIFLPWLIYLTLQGNSNAKDIAINTANDHHVSDELKKIYQAIDNQRTDTKERFDKLEGKFDQLLMQENRMFRELFGTLKQQP